MKLFTCANCSKPLYFENYYCENCGLQVGFNPGSMEFMPAVGEENGLIIPWHADIKDQLRYCSNRVYNACNWLVPAGENSSFCKACELNRIIPSLDNADYLRRWQTLEIAKHRLIYSLIQLNLPIVSKIKDPVAGLLFDFMADDTQKVMTGHDEGVITINIAEADDIEREMARRNLDEVYRTVLGHFRHEVGHYYWDRLIRDTGLLNEFRLVFGNEQQDYETALNTHYSQGAPLNWNQSYISAYATMHPWEDWAETWAHYLHIVDTLETAHAFGLKIRPASELATDLGVSIAENPYHIKDFEKIINRWLPLTVALNSLNRSMGLPDAYPFVIPQPVIQKLQFIHQLLHKQSIVA
ncbi:MAG: putative zinc-binding metallopeptidase [Terrimonas sp.]|nr:putative zinc-binding metallopeptidase [Terrimonas sp.]OJY81535.1 MAG: hypothetical protein BGP13_20320 [Sphingobacteriales bacterium 40-81]